MVGFLFGVVIYTHNKHYERRQPLGERIRYKKRYDPKKVIYQEYQDSPLETFKRIGQLVQDSQDNPNYAYQVRELALKILRRYGDGRQLSDVEQAQAIYHWLVTNMNYVNDPYFNELIHSAEVLIDRYSETGELSGDCDDFTILACALMLSVGIPCRSRMIKVRDPLGRINWAHIYPMAGVGGQWIAMDATEKDRYFGWEPPEGKLPGYRKDWNFV